MKSLSFVCILLSLLFSIDADAQVKKDSANLRGAIDSIRDGRDLNKNNKGVIDTGINMTDTIDVTPEIPTPPTPNNPSSHDPEPSPVHPTPPLPPNPPVNPTPGEPEGPDSIKVQSEGG